MMVSKRLLCIALLLMVIATISLAKDSNLENPHKRDNTLRCAKGECCCTKWGSDKENCKFANDIVHECCKCGGKCFPGDARVRLSDGHAITMSHLNVGDILSTVNSLGEEVPTEVLGFMKREENVYSTYKHILTDTGNDITLSADHLIMVSKGNEHKEWTSRFASEIEIGDHVTVTNDRDGVLTAKVVGTELDIMKGAYVPLTKEGTLLVGDVTASCYAGFDHDWAHFFITPMRWFPGLFNADSAAEGSHNYVDLVMQIGRCVMPEGLQTKPNQAWQQMASVMPWQSVAN